MEITNRGILSDGTIYQYSNILALDYTCTYIIPFNKENYEKDKKAWGISPHAFYGVTIVPSGIRL